MKRFMFLLLAVVCVALYVCPVNAQWFDQNLSNNMQKLIDCEGLPNIAGTYFFVNSKTGRSTFDGKSKARPCSTLAQAHAKVTAGLGDAIVLVSEMSATNDTTYSFLITSPCTLKTGEGIIGIDNGCGYFNRARIATAGTALKAAGMKKMNVVVYVYHLKLQWLKKAARLLL